MGPGIPPRQNDMTDARENITFPQLPWRVGNKLLNCEATSAFGHKRKATVFPFVKESWGAGLLRSYEPEAVISSTTVPKIMD